MSVSITTDIFCDGCNCWEHGLTGVKMQSVEARKIASGKGWTKKRGNGTIEDYCPECSKNMK